LRGFKLRIDEIEIIARLPEPNEELLKQLSKDATLIGNNGSFDIYQNIFGNQEVYFTGQPLPIGYLVVRNGNDRWWAMSLWVDPRNRNQKIGQGLMVYVVKQVKGHLIMDLEMTEASIRMTEKLIATGAVNASVVDYQDQTAIAYDPSNLNDQNRPMYNDTITGVNRPALRYAEKDRYTWVLETRERRGGILQENYRKGPGVEQLIENRKTYAQFIRTMEE
jgi:hypothetical protein